MSNGCFINVRDISAVNNTGCFVPFRYEDFYCRKIDVIKINVQTLFIIIFEIKLTLGICPGS